MNILQIIILAVIQGLAELLPVSSSAHVIVAEKLMGMDPSTPELTFLLVMLHTGTMFAVLFYFWPRWRAYLSDATGRWNFVKYIVIATACTGVLGLGLKFLLEHWILPALTGHAESEIEHMFKNLPAISVALLVVGTLITIAGWTAEDSARRTEMNNKDAIWIGLIQGLCLPFRGFSRSGATISVGMLRGVSKPLAEDFSFALAVVVTPPVILMQLRRLLKAADAGLLPSTEVVHLLAPGVMGMVFSFAAGLIALRWLSSWLEKGRWRFFGYYCYFAAAMVFTVHLYLGG